MARLLFVNRIGVGIRGGLTINAKIVMSLLLDKYGWLGLDVHPLSGGRLLGAALMVAGIALITRF